MYRTQVSPGLPAVTGTLRAWYRADACQRIGTAVNFLEDLSGKGNHLQSASLATSPTYVPTGVNSLPCLSFDGSDDRLQSIAEFSLTRNTTAFIVTGTTTTRRMMMEHGLGNGHYWYADGNAAFAVFGSTGVGYARFFKTNWVPLTKSYLVAKYSGGTSLTLRVNGVTQTADSTDGVGQTDTLSKILYVGGRSDGTLYHNGQIAEIILYDSELSSADIATVESYLATRYAI